MASNAGDDLAGSRSIEEQRFNEPNLRTTSTARQHIVPRFYLRNFTEAGKLAVFDLDEDKAFTTSPRNAAFQIGFYDLQVGDLVMSTEDCLADSGTAELC